MFGFDNDNVLVHITFADEPTFQTMRYCHCCDNIVTYEWFKFMLYTI